MSASATRDQIWRRGCRGEPLTETEPQQFTDLARSRFHTFAMSANHAEQERKTDDAVEWIDGLVRGLTRELLEHPGLEREWLASEFADDYHGKRVTSGLSRAPSDG